jgi:hypothetical protein
VTDEELIEGLSFPGHSRPHTGPSYLNKPDRASQWRDQGTHQGRRHLSNEDAIVRLVGAILLEQNDEWAVQRARYMTLDTIAPLSDEPIINLPALAG